MTNCLSFQMGVHLTGFPITLDERAHSTWNTCNAQVGESAAEGAVTWPYLVLDSLSIQTARAVGRRGEATRRRGRRPGRSNRGLDMTGVNAEASIMKHASSSAAVCARIAADTSGRKIVTFINFSERAIKIAPFLHVIFQNEPHKWHHFVKMTCKILPGTPRNLRH